jgi:hypothetical protein
MLTGKHNKPPCDLLLLSCSYLADSYLPDAVDTFLLNVGSFKNYTA